MFVNSKWIEYLFHEFTINKLSTSWMNYAFTMKDLSFALFPYRSIILFENWPWITICPRIHYLLRWKTTNSLSFSRIHHLFRGFTIFLANSLWIYFVFRDSLWIFAKFLLIHYLFREFTINGLSTSRIQCELTWCFPTSLWF